MAALKTQKNDRDVVEFIHSFAEGEQKVKDSLFLLEFMKKITGYEPVMWGKSIIGFGQYHYKSQRSRQEGDWPLIGFSPRKSAISLYTYTGMEQHAYLLENLGKFKMGKACIYVKKVSDIDLSELEKMIRTTITYMKENYETSEG